MQISNILMWIYAPLYGYHRFSHFHSEWMEGKLSDRENFHHSIVRNCCSSCAIEFFVVNRRMPKCRSLLQTQWTFSTMKFDQICVKIVTVRPVFVLKKSSKTFEHSPVKRHKLSKSWIPRSFLACYPLIMFQHVDGGILISGCRRNV